ncbi:hypothetical protein QTP86_003578 [Hemibagrus guttatus]|nr:hypothetical protein QTP86_003578 [Hemibagrus guttatus]
MMKVIQSHPVLFACAAAYGKNLSATLVTLSCESTQDSITPTSSAVYGKEEQAVTLSCDYEYTVAMNNLQWYRQYSNAAPEFLVLLTESGANQTGDTPRPHLSAKVHKSLKRVDLEIPSCFSIRLCTVLLRLAAHSDRKANFTVQKPTETSNMKVLKNHNKKTGSYA